jgi:hypothetical protein
MQGPDIQVTIGAQPGLSTGTVAFLYVYMSIDGGPMQAYPISLQKPLAPNDAFLLHPDTATPAKYNIALQIDALDTNGGLVAFGTAAGDVSANGCNKLEALLSVIPGGGGGNSDLGTDGPVIPLPDGFIAPDLSGGTLPQCQVQQASEVIDEDADGRANTCDLCPADADQNPVDSDGDGVPDACDPDPTKAGNRTLYFAPYNQDDGHWSGGYQINNSFIRIDSGQGSATGARVVYASNALDVMQANVRVQTILYVPQPCCYQGPNYPDTGIYLGSAADPSASNANGMACVITYHLGQGPDSVDLYPIVNGVAGASVSTQASLGLQTYYRIRLTQRKMGPSASSYTCEVLEMNPGRQPVTVTATGAEATQTQFMALRANSIESHLHSVVAESTVP